MAKQQQKDQAVPAQPDTEDQSGSAGRRTDKGGSGPDKDTGQGRYGQSGFGGKQGSETSGQARYRKSGPDGGQEEAPDSNQGSGRADRESDGVDNPKMPGRKKP